MIPFKDEEQRSKEVRENLREEFDFARRIYSSWADSDRLAWKTSPTFPDNAFNLTLMLDLQAGRLFRSAVELCYRSEGFCSHILARSLFETALALAFILKRSVRILVEPVKGNPNRFVAKLAPARRAGAKHHHFQHNSLRHAREEWISQSRTASASLPCSSSAQGFVIWHKSCAAQRYEAYHFAHRRALAELACRCV